MFGMFKNNKQQPNPEWLRHIKETQERWFSFLEKLEAKMQELCQAAIPELKALKEQDTDIYKRNFAQVLNGIRGQLENIRKKAYDTFDEKILCQLNDYPQDVWNVESAGNILTDFRIACSDRYHKQFQETYEYWINQIDATQKEDLEIKYRAILQEYELIKDKFTCKQCGGGITLEKIFFINAYIACPHCKTQNTFEPSTQAKMLQHFAQELAAQRTENLYADYQKEEQKERELYYKMHNNRVSFSDDKKQKEVKEQQNAELEKERQQAIRNAPALHKKYIRAKYAEWIKIVPDLKTHLEKRLEEELSRIKD